VLKSFNNEESFKFNKFFAKNVLRVVGVAWLILFVVNIEITRRVEVKD